MYVTIIDTLIESLDAQEPTGDPLTQDILRRLSIIEFILSTLLDQAYDGSCTKRLPH